MKKLPEIDLPAINYILSLIANWHNEAVAKRKLREMAEEYTPIKIQCQIMLRHPQDEVEKYIAKMIRT